jgi:YfiR/HmsC-like
VSRSRSACRPGSTLFVLWGLGLLCARAAPAQVEVPAERQVLVLSKALSYDSELKARVGSDILVGVLSKPGNTASEAMASAVMKAFKLVSNVRVQGVPISAREIRYAGGAAALAGAIDTQNIDLLYVCVGLEAEIPAITEITRKKHVVTLGSREDQIRKGIALGVVAIDGRPTIVLNLTAARKEGADFSPDLLRVARVIR